MHTDLSISWMSVQIEDGFIYIMNESMSPHFNSVFDLQVNHSETCLISLRWPNKTTKNGMSIHVNVQQNTWNKFLFCNPYFVKKTLMRHNHSCMKILFSKMHTYLLFQDLLFQEVEDSNRRILMQNANIIEKTVIIVRQYWNQVMYFM